MQFLIPLDLLMDSSRFRIHDLLAQILLNILIVSIHVNVYL